MKGEICPHCKTNLDHRAEGECFKGYECIDEPN